MVGVWLLGHLHRDGGLRAQRRGAGAVARCVRPPGGRADGGTAGGAGGDGGGRLPLHHHQPVQSAATAEPDHLAAADLEHRRLLRRAAAVLLPGRPVHQPELRAQRQPDRPGLCVRPDRGRGRGSQRPGGDVRGACVPSGAAAAGAAGGSRAVHGRAVPAARRSLAAVLALGAAEAVLLLDDQAAYNDFKAIYAPLHTPDAKIVASVNSPRGDYALLDDFTERVDTDISNNAGMLGVDGPPRSFGLYRDGNRIAALPSGRRDHVGLCGGGAGCAALSADPARRGCMLAGASGGFRTAEVLRARRLAGPRAGAGTGTVPHRCATGWARSLPVAAVSQCPGRRQRAAGCRRAAGCTTWWICRRTSWMPPRPTRARSPTRRSSPTCTRWRRTGWCRSRSRSATSRSMPCACWRRCGRRCWPPASTIRRRM